MTSCLIGRSLLESCVIAGNSRKIASKLLPCCFGSIEGLSDGLENVLTGGGANLKLGQHLALPKDTPLCNVWLTMLQGMGIKTERHGDSSGVVKELQA